MQLRAGAGAVLNGVISVVRAYLARPLEVALLGLLGFAGLYALASLWLPFGWDHGMMASVGDTVARGGLPYRDAWEIKGPMAYGPFALATLLFGHGMWGIRVVELAILAPTLALFFAMLALRTNAAVGLGAAIGLYLWLNSHGFFFSAQPEIWVAMLAAAATCLALPAREGDAPTPRGLVIAGALVACVGLIKPFYLGFGLAPLVVVALAPAPSLARRIVLAAWLAAGAAAPIILVLGGIVARGGLPAMLEVQLDFNLGTYAGIDARLGLKEMVKALVGFGAQAPVTLLATFAIVGLWARRAERVFVAALVAWLSVAVLGVVVQGKFYVYHWFPVYPPLMACAALGAEALWRASSASRAPGLAAAAAAAAFTLHVAAAPAREIALWAGRMTGVMSDADYYARYQFQSYTPADAVAVARHICARTAPDEGVYVWGVDAVVRYLADRPDPTRFVYDLPLSAEGPLQAGYRAEMMAALDAAPPAYIVIGRPWHGGDKRAGVDAFPGFSALLEEAYAQELVIGGLDLYRRRGHEASPEAGRGGCRRL